MAEMDIAQPQRQADASAASVADGPKGQTFEFDVAMSCGGCKGAIDRVLGKLEGIRDFNVDLATQKATINILPESTLSFKDVHDKISKTGKKINDRHIGTQRVNEDGAPVDGDGNLISA